MSSNFVGDISDDKEVRTYVRSCIVNNNKIDKEVWGKHFLTPAAKRILLLSTVFEDKKKYYARLYNFLEPSQINGMTLKYFGIPNMCGEVSSHFLSTYSYLKKLTRATRTAGLKNSKDKRIKNDATLGSFEFSEIMREEASIKNRTGHSTTANANHCPADCFSHMSQHVDDNSSILSTQSNEPYDVQKVQESQHLRKYNKGDKQPLNIPSKSEYVNSKRKRCNEDDTAKTINSLELLSLDINNKVLHQNEPLCTTFIKHTDLNAKTNKSAKKLYSSPEIKEFSQLQSDINTTTNDEDERKNPVQGKRKVGTPVSKDIVMIEYKKKLETMGMKPKTGSQFEFQGTMKKTKQTQQPARKSARRKPQETHKDLSKIKVQETIIKSKRQNQKLSKKNDCIKIAKSNLLKANIPSKNTSKKLNYTKENSTGAHKQSPISEYSETIEANHEIFNKMSQSKENDGSPTSPLSGRFNDLNYSNISMIQRSQSEVSVSSKKTHVSESPVDDVYKDNLSSLNLQNLNDLPQNDLISHNTSSCESSSSIISKHSTPKTDHVIESQVKKNHTAAFKQNPLPVHGKTIEMDYEIFDRVVQNQDRDSSPISLLSGGSNALNYSNISMIQRSQSEASVSSKKTHVSESTECDETEDDLSSVNIQDVHDKLHNDFVPLNASSNKHSQTISECSTSEVDSVCEGSPEKDTIEAQSITDHFSDDLSFKDFVYQLQNVPNSDDTSSSKSSQRRPETRSTTHQQKLENLQPIDVNLKKEKSQTAQLKDLHAISVVQQQTPENNFERMEEDDAFGKDDKQSQDLKVNDNFRVGSIAHIMNVNEEQDQEPSMHSPESSQSTVISSSQTSLPYSSHQKPQFLQKNELQHFMNDDDQLTSIEREQEVSPKSGSSSSGFSGTNFMTSRQRYSSRIGFDPNKSNAIEIDSTLSPILSRTSILLPSVKGAHTRDNKNARESLKFLNDSEDRISVSEGQYPIENISMTGLLAKMRGELSSEQELNMESFLEDIITNPDTEVQNSTRNEPTNDNAYSTLFSKVLMKEDSQESDTDSRSTLVTNLSSISNTSKRLKDGLIVPPSQSPSSDASLTPVEKKIIHETQHAKTNVAQNHAQKVFSSDYYDYSKSDPPFGKQANSPDFTAVTAQKKSRRKPLKNNNYKTESNVQQASDEYSFSRHLFTDKSINEFSPQRKENQKKKSSETSDLASSSKPDQSKCKKISDKYSLMTGNSAGVHNVEEGGRIKPKNFDSADKRLKRKKTKNIQVTKASTQKLNHNTDEQFFNTNFKVPLDISLSTSGTSSFHNESIFSGDSEMKFLKKDTRGRSTLKTEDEMILKQYKHSEVNFLDTSNASKNYSVSSSASNIISSFSGVERSKDSKNYSASSNASNIISGFSGVERNKDTKRRPLADKNISRESNCTANKEEEDNDSFFSQLQLDKVKWNSELCEIKSQESGGSELSSKSSKKSIQQRKPLRSTSRYNQRSESAEGSIKRKNLRADGKRGIKKSFGSTSKNPLGGESSDGDRLKNYYDIMGMNDDDSLDSYLKFP